MIHQKSSPTLPLDEARAPAEKKKGATARTLEMDIIFNRLAPGERLIEDDLMARFGQSRHKIRCAIDTLVQRGLAVRLQNRGAHVCSYTYKQIAELYELRNILQEAAIASIRFPVQPEIITRLRILNDAHATASERNDLEDVFSLNNQFHRTVFSCCDNKELCLAIEMQARRMFPVRTSSFRKPGYLALVQKEHQDMISALLQGDRAMLSALTRAHIERPMNAYITEYALTENDG